MLDEVHQTPGLFAPLRGIIDRRRRAGRRTGQFLFLGSASINLMQQSGETLAGRVAYCELYPLSVSEVGGGDCLRLWQRGGFPESFLVETDERGFDWRLDFIRIYLERDIPTLGPRIPAETLRRFWTMLAHNQGQTFNAAAFARGLDVGGGTIGRYLDLMVDLLLVRRLQPWRSNLGRRLVKAPKVYVRDSGICHALLGIETLDELLGHPVVGGSWEGFIVETIVGALPRHASWGYYRTAGGAEIDLVVDMGAGEIWAIEIKRSTAPSVSRGFYNACEDLKPSASSSSTLETKASRSPETSQRFRYLASLRCSRRAGDLGVRFDVSTSSTHRRLNELRGRRGRSLSLRSLSLSKGRKAGGGGQHERLSRMSPWRLPRVRSVSA